MTHDELIVKAKEHARLFINTLPVDPKVIEGNGRVREVVIIYFGNETGSSLKVILDKETGEFIGAEA